MSSAHLPTDRRTGRARLLGGLGTRLRFGAVELLDIAPEEAVEVLASLARVRQGVGVHMCNAYTLVSAEADEAHRASLADDALNLVDGTPVSWYSRAVTREPSRGPVRGPGLMKAMLDRPHLRHFLLGGTDEVLADLRTAIERDHPAAEVVGAVAPPFRDPTDEDVAAYAEAVRRSGANVVWVGLGTPRQDLLIARLAGSVDAVLVGVGAAFDFLSGHKPEAPAYLHGTGFEWVHRLLSEPGRLWRRYLISNAVFVRLAARELRRQRRAVPVEAAHA
ncbi:N-acetylglucosaminyldiphosphoundecaprenol N-acetyl-beta-D-mannosaminyltransferase [Motilibacter rhizosphaerae]|uniref:N-acetylglucosaminyldiphosphoundecaprenol N-acetyl-beta-D-mannosaminyltransferase n=1 Tax=Motilibacter rhizosphaerae TaxID=598652 RepID=A0A4Q7NVK4_9ACTN|nr:WecB/TagA/CpsF family glycosyltransferase [Motilibacter rhizosphaerae]RZS91281.1 N-acetylglucosaminyldiphosphoundecaprenol N-acetyl-beta-D-mannosaminyltransferase [Motilibacter rhizosphaerae]